MKSLTHTGAPVLAGQKLARCKTPQMRLLRVSASAEPPKRRREHIPIKRGIPIQSQSNEESTDSASQYRDQPVPTADDNDPFLLPIMLLSKTKIPTETVQLQIFEPRYRLMFKLVAKSRSKRFGVVLHDQARGVMESVGTLCELTHLIPVPERRRLFVSARAVGRFTIDSRDGVVSDKPFVTAECVSYKDEAPVGLDAEAHVATVSAIEHRVWEAMLDVRRLASKLFTGVDRKEIGDEVFTLETRRYNPDPKVRANVKIAAGSDPEALAAAELSGLMGDLDVPREGVVEHICSDALRQLTEAERQERFSYALVKALEMDEKQRADALLQKSTAARLLFIEELVVDGRNYLAARSTLRDMF